MEKLTRTLSPRKSRLREKVVERMFRHRMHIHTMCSAVRVIFYWQQRVKKVAEAIEEADQEGDLIERVGSSFVSQGVCNVFLGGSCNPTTWRKDIAIPFCEQHSITFYNPQVDDWTPDLVEIEVPHHSHLLANQTPPPGTQP